MSMKKSNDTIGNRTRDLLACSAVPQPTVPPAACPVSKSRDFKNSPFGTAKVWLAVPYAEGMNQSALLNVEWYISFLHSPGSEHENLPQIKYITYSTTNKMHLLSQIIYSCKTPYMFRTVFPPSGAQNCVYSNGICQTAAAMILCAMQHCTPSFVHGCFAGKCVLTGSME
jgi:hypothetical protein